jgi:hypothetical protein
MTSAFPAAREWGQSDDPLESRSTPQEEIARGGAAGRAKEIDDMRRLRRKARGEEMKAQEMLELADRYEKHGMQSLVSREEIKIVVRALRLAAQADAPGGQPQSPQAWCQPMDCGKHTPRKFMIYFDDPDHGVMVFDNEDEAREAFERKNTAWNCYLFGTLPLTRPDGNSK